MSSVTLSLKKLSVKMQTVATVGAIVSAVALPQIFHLMGAMSGLGTSLGEIFLPMHLPIILVGLIAGPYAGAISGFFAPLISFWLTQMPTAAMLPYDDRALHLWLKRRNTSQSKDAFDIQNSCFTVVGACYSRPCHSYRILC